MWILINYSLSLFPLSNMRPLPHNVMKVVVVETVIQGLSKPREALWPDDWAALVSHHNMQLLESSLLAIDLQENSMGEPCCMNPSVSPAKFKAPSAHPAPFCLSLILSSGPRAMCP